jgi:hypothetical protein
VHVAHLFNGCRGLSVLTRAARNVEILCDDVIGEKVKRSTTKRTSTTTNNRSNGGGVRGTHDAEMPCDGELGEKKVERAMTIKVTTSKRG